MPPRSNRPDVLQVVSLADAVQPRLLGPDGRPLTPYSWGPGKPIEPELTLGSDPLALAYAPGQNLGLTPRAWRGAYLTPFQQLRALGEFDLVRCVINDVKGQIRGMKWDVRVRKEFKDQAKSLQPIVDAIRQWVEVPDPLADLEFDDWLGLVLEEILVTDALSLYPHFTIGGKPIGLEQVDGAMIIPLIDDRGRPPLSRPNQKPTPAYIQIAHGRVVTEFPFGELWYTPFNRRPDMPYGHAPVETVIMTVNLALRKSVHELDFYTSGSVPDALYRVPTKWTPDQIAKFQMLWDDIMSGSSLRRAGGMRFIPGGEGAGLENLKEHTWAYEGWEWLARIIAWAFQVSPVPIAKQMNRATATAMEESITESGVRPVANFVARIVNRYIKRILKQAQLEFIWAADDVEDATMVFERNVAYITAGVKSLDEVRRETDLQPTGVDEPFLMVNNSPVFISQLKQMMKAPLPKPEAATPARPADSKPTETTDENQNKEAEELVRWRRLALKRAKAGQRQRYFYSENLGVTKHIRLLAKLRRTRTVEDVQSVFQKSEAAALGIEDAQRLFFAALFDWLYPRTESILNWATAQLLGKLRKLDIEDSIDMDLTPVYSDFVRALNRSHQSGMEDTEASLSGSFSRPPERAIEYAQERAAELVGKKWVNGKLVENPDPKWSITEKLRGDINAKVTQALDQGWSTQRLRSELMDQLGSARASTVARTETAFAYNDGALQVFKEAKVDYVEVVDGTGCLPQGHVDGADEADGDPGVVQKDVQAEGQVWTLSQMAKMLIGHPNCVRAFLEYVEEE